MTGQDMKTTSAVTELNYTVYVSMFYLYVM